MSVKGDINDFKNRNARKACRDIQNGPQLNVRKLPLTQKEVLFLRKLLEK